MSWLIDQKMRHGLYAARSRIKSDTDVSGIMIRMIVYMYTVYNHLRSYVCGCKLRKIAQHIFVL